MGKRTDHKAKVASLLRAERKKQALVLRRNGGTYEQIGEELGVTKSCVHKWVDEAIKELPKEDAALTLGLELERLDRDLRRNETILSKLDSQLKRGGDVTPAIVRMVTQVQESNRRIQDRRSAYLGHDAAQRHEHTGADGAPIEINVSEMTDDQLRAIVARASGGGARAAQAPARKRDAPRLHPESDAEVA